MFGLAGLRKISRSYHETYVPLIRRREEPIHNNADILPVVRYHEISFLHNLRLGLA